MRSEYQDFKDYFETHLAKYQRLGNLGAEADEHYYFKLIAGKLLYVHYKKFSKKFKNNFANLQNNSSTKLFVKENTFIKNKTSYIRCQ